jgi:tagaturonate epimerase
MSIRSLMTAETIGEPLSDSQTVRLAEQLTEVTGGQVYPASFTTAYRAIFFLVREGIVKKLGVVTGSGIPGGLTGSGSTVSIDGESLTLSLCPLDAENAVAMRELFPYLVPQTLGLRKSAGCGDRLGLATPGHLRAIRKSTMAPILAQQSIRENARTGRTPQQVMDEAMWGIFEDGWRGGFGADADHLKSTADVDVCAAAGFTFYTIDPGEHVDNEANEAPVGVLREKIGLLPWNELETSWEETRQALGSSPVDLGSISLTLTEEDLLRAAAKYGRVVAHTVKMYRHLAKVKGDQPFELEMSVDETETVTTLAEHIYIAHELKRLGVVWVSLAPRYVGDFEKGVDYIGDLTAFEESFSRHLAVAKTFGPYKLSLHSGSDKFSIYPIASRIAGELVHLKTAGTSYLEALRAIAVVNPALFRRIVAFARERYPIDRASYHVSALVERTPDPETLGDDQLADLLENFHAREILHVTFGSVLHHPEFREPFFMTLRGHEQVYYAMLEKHFGRHFAPFDEAARAIGD